MKMQRITGDTQDLMKQSQELTSLCLHYLLMVNLKLSILQKKEASHSWNIEKKEINQSEISLGFMLKICFRNNSNKVMFLNYEQAKILQNETSFNTAIEKEIREEIREIASSLTWVKSKMKTEESKHRIRNDLSESTLKTFYHTNICVLVVICIMGIVQGK